MNAKHAAGNHKPGQGRNRRSSLRLFVLGTAALLIGLIPVPSLAGDTGSDSMQPVCEVGTSSNGIYSVNVCHKVELDSSCPTISGTCRVKHTCWSEGLGPSYVFVWHYAEVRCNLYGEQHEDECLDWYDPCEARNTERDLFEPNTQCMYRAWVSHGEAGADAIIIDVEEAEAEPEQIWFRIDAEDGLVLC